MRSNMIYDGAPPLESMDMETPSTEGPVCEGAQVHSGSTDDVDVIWKGTTYDRTPCCTIFGCAFMNPLPVRHQCPASDLCTSHAVWCLWILHALSSHTLVDAALHYVNEHVHLTASMEFCMMHANLESLAQPGWWPTDVPQ
jgi:hypothetical protein